MADYTSYCLQDKNEMTALGNAIRAKAGISGTLTVPEMTTAVKNIKQTTTVVTDTPKVAIPSITYLTPIIDEKMEPQMKISSTSSATGYAPASSIEVYTVTDTALSKTNTYTGSSRTINLLPSSGTVRKSTHTDKTMTARAICGNGMGSAMTNFYTDNQMGAIQVIHCSITGGQNHIELAKDTGIFTGLTSLEQEAYATLYVTFMADDNSEKFDDQELRLSRISSCDDCDMSDQVFRGEVPGYCIVELSVDLYNPDDGETGCDGNDDLNYSSRSYPIGYSILNYIKVIYYKPGYFGFYGNTNSFDHTPRHFYFITKDESLQIERGEYNDGSANRSNSFRSF